MNPLTRFWRLLRSLLPGQPPSEAGPETDSQRSARLYWNREVEAEKKRRGTADPPERR